AVLEFPQDQVILENRAIACFLLGNTFGELGDYDGAAAWFAQALALGDIDEGARRWQSLTRINLGGTAHFRGDHERAVAQLGDGIRQSHDEGNELVESLGLSRLAYLERDRGDVAAAAAHWAASLALNWGQRWRIGIVGCLTGLAGVAVAGRQRERA